MKRLLYISLLSLALVSGLGLLAAPTPTYAFDLSKGIVGNITNKECSEKGNCTFCDFIQLFVILERVILGLFAGLALVMLIWGGQGIITSAGNQEKYTSSRKLITSTLLGILIVLAGFFLINALVGILTTQKGSSSFNNVLFGSDWWEAQCLSSKTTERSFCANQLEGTPCGIIQPNQTPKRVCSGGQCVDTCTERNRNAPIGSDFACVAKGVTLGTNATPTNNYCENGSEQCWAICPPTPPAGPCGTTWKCSEEGYWVCS